MTAVAQKVSARAAPEPSPPGAERWREIATARFDASIAGTTRFFEANADAVSAVALEMARRFERGGRLLVFGEGAAATDAQHVSVEFVHPVIVGKRALPAIAFTNDVGTLTRGDGSGFAGMLEVLGRPQDIALAIRTADSAAVSRALEAAAVSGMLAVSIETDAGDAPATGHSHHAFRLPADDALVAQEIGETLYHVLWELVHLFLEHGVTDDGPAT